MTDKMKWFLIALSFLAFPVNAVDRFALIWGKFDADSKEERAEIAVDLRDRVASLAQFVPPPKPEDKQWVEKETADIKELGNSPAAGARFLQLYDSPKQQHVKLHATLAEIVAALACAAGDTTPLPKEMVCWSRASVLLVDSALFQDAISILIKSGLLSDGDIAGPLGIAVDAKVYHHTYGSWGRAIHRYLVHPYLERLADERAGAAPEDKSQPKAPQGDSADPGLEVDGAR